MVETVFALPGMGQLLVRVDLRARLPGGAGASTMVFACATVLVNFLADIADRRRSIRGSKL